MLLVRVSRELREGGGRGAQAMGENSRDTPLTAATHTHMEPLVVYNIHTYIPTCT